MEDHEATTQLLTALGLTAADAYRTEHNTLYFVSDVLVDALAAKLTENTSNLKNALEKFVADQGGVDHVCGGMSQLGHCEKSITRVVPPKFAALVSVSEIICCYEPATSRSKWVYPSINPGKEAYRIHHHLGIWL